MLNLPLHLRRLARNILHSHVCNASSNTRNGLHLYLFQRLLQHENTQDETSIEELDQTVPTSSDQLGLEQDKQR